MRELAPQAAKDQLLPTRQLLLAGRAWRSPLLLLEDAENLCGVQAAWADDKRLLLRVGAAQRSHLRVHNGQTWGPVVLQVVVHEDAVLMQRWSADGERCLAVIGNCEQTLWNLYLRRRGEALFNDAMQKGWGDPDVFGGFGWEQVVASLQWTGPRSARVLVHGDRRDVTVRSRIADVDLQWGFTHKDKKAGPQKGRPLPLLKFIPAPI